MHSSVFALSDLPSCTAEEVAKGNQGQNVMLIIFLVGLSISVFVYFWIYKSKIKNDKWLLYLFWTPLALLLTFGIAFAYAVINVQWCT